MWVVFVGGVWVLGCVWVVCVWVVCVGVCVWAVCGCWGVSAHVPGFARMSVAFNGRGGGPGVSIAVFLNDNHTCVPLHAHHRRLLEACTCKHMKRVQTHERSRALATALPADVLVLTNYSQEMPSVRETNLYAIYWTLNDAKQRMW